MTSLQGFATQMNPTTQVVCAYATNPLTLLATLTEQWVVQGTFTVPEPVSCRLSVEGFVIYGATMKVALFCPAKMGDSEVVITEYAPSTVKNSAIISLLPGVVYLIAVSVVSESLGEDMQGTSRTVHLVDP